MEELFFSYSWKVVLISGAILVVLAGICLSIKEIGSNLKKLLYILIAAVTILSTAYLAGSTIYLNLTSWSGGPVHWHADYEIWACGKEVELVHSHGLSNRVGSSTVHVHDDKRIHQEGVIYHPEDASLGNFFKEIGGNITGDALMVSTENGMMTYRSGDMCDGQISKLQVFAYQVEGRNFRQHKLDNPASFVISQYSQVPPGDCIIVEFGPSKNKTDKICRSFKVAQEIGKLGVEIP